MGKHKPEGFEPPYVAYEARYRDETKQLISAFIGVQQRDDSADAERASLQQLLGAEYGPDIVEQGWHADVAGSLTHVHMAYWRDPASFQRWSDNGIAGWLQTNTQLNGKWIEVARVSPSALDTLIADADVNWGLARLGDRIDVTPDHGYWGGTRDRIRISASEDISNPEGPGMTVPKDPPLGLGQVVDVVMPPNVVVARGGPDWSRCVGDELEEFLNSVYPAYVRGGRYLRDSGAESGCYAASLVQETDKSGKNVKRNHLIAYFVQLDDLERWTKSHPTHLEIFGRFLALFKRIERMPAVNLYHEVSVIPTGNLTATYVNCLPNTGLLRYGRVRVQPSA
jgi:aliphatic aldoxime dehydratase